MTPRRPPRPGTHTLTIHGHAKPQGSKRHIGNGIMVESSKGLKPWRDQLKLLAQAHRPPVPLDGPVAITLTFRFARPKAHYGTGRNAQTLRADAPVYCTTRRNGDGSKLQRAVEDALVDACWMTDDSLIARWIGEKRWCCRHTETPGVRITLAPLTT